MKLLVILAFAVLIGVAFGAGVYASPKLQSVATDGLFLKLPKALRCLDYWVNRYQTFLGVLVAVAVAYFTIDLANKQTSVSERQFLTSQLQGLISDEANLQFVVTQLNEIRSQKELFRHNIAFLDTEGDKTTGWLNANNHLMSAYGNVQNFRLLVSQNTAKFLGPTSARTALIAKLDEIIGSQEKLRNDFLAWANLNKLAAPAAADPDPEQKTTYFQTKSRALSMWDEAAPLAKAAIDELVAKIAAVERDTSVLRQTISSKEP